MRTLITWPWWPRRKEIPVEEVEEIEAKLQENLVPVKPRSAFVSSLKERILTAPEPKLPSMPPALQYSILGALGLFSSVLIVVTGIRATVTLIGALGLISQLRKRSAPA
jgi:hypothetical protein